MRVCARDGIRNVCLRCLTYDGGVSCASLSLSHALQHLVYCKISTWIYELITSSMFVNKKIMRIKNKNLIEPLAYGMFHSW